MVILMLTYESIANKMLAYTSSTIINPTTSTTIATNTTTSSLDSIKTDERVGVDDMDIAYRIFGAGEPLLLIPGFSMTMDIWPPIMLDKLSLSIFQSIQYCIL